MLAILGGTGIYTLDEVEVLDEREPFCFNEFFLSRLS